VTDTLPEPAYTGPSDLPEPTAPTHPYWDLYREAQAACSSYRGLLRNLPQPGRWLITDAELTTYCRQVLRRRPFAQCNREHQVAVWLRRIVVSAPRWHRCWTAAVVQAGMDAAAAKAAGPPDWEGGTC
jgi:hypothetical protein